MAEPISDALASQIPNKATRGTMCRGVNTADNATATTRLSPANANDKNCIGLPLYCLRSSVRYLDLEGRPARGQLVSSQRYQMFPCGAGVRSKGRCVAGAIMVDHGVAPGIRHFDAHSRARAPAAAVRSQRQDNGCAVLRCDAAYDRTSILGRHHVQIRGTEDRLCRGATVHRVGGIQAGAGEAQIALTATIGVTGNRKSCSAPGIGADVIVPPGIVVKLDIWSEGRRDR